MLINPRMALQTGWDVWHTDLNAAHPADLPAHASYGCALPMDARTLLARQGLCRDPRVGMASRESDWVVTRAWWWRTSCAMPVLQPGQRVFLRTRGVDFLADYWVNGVPVGSGESFNQQRWYDITAALQPGGTQELLVRLLPIAPERIAHPEMLVHGLQEASDGYTAVAFTDLDFKARMFWGGDHCAFLMNCGFAIPPDIVVADRGLVRHLGIRYTFDADGATVSGAIVCDADVWEPTPYTVTLTPKNFTGEAYTFTGVCQPQDGVFSVPFADLAVRPWWPHHLGDPHCYDLAVTVGGVTTTVTTGFRHFARMRNDAFVASPAASVFDWHPYENNEGFAQAYYKGFDAIREAGEAWPDTPREGNYDFRHVVNGQELFIRGGSLVPPTLFWADWSDDYQRRLVRQAREANLNTLRIWGGGYLLSDAFYEEADLQGVMIAQDFLNFAPMIHEDQVTQQRREREYRSIARQLSAHPSVVLLNGGNELLQEKVNRLDRPVYAQMARVVREDAPQAIFHPSSPIGPEVHGPWFFDLEHPARYNSYHTPFNSECGVTGSASLKSLQHVLAEDELAVPLGPAWFHRAPCGCYAQFLRRYTEFFGPLPGATAADVVRRTQWVQAIGYQYLTEEYRRQQPRMNGFYLWEFSEPWLSLTWAVTDHYLVRKPAFWTLQRACAPLAVSARFASYVVVAGSQVTYEIAVCTDSLHQGESVTVEAVLVAADGHVCAREGFTTALNAAVVSVGQLACAAPASPFFILKLTVQTEDHTIAENAYVFTTLPVVDRTPIRTLFLSGGCFENAFLHQVFQANGLTIDERIVGPHAPLDLATVDFSGYDLIVLGPVFNPLTSLGEAFFTAVRAAVETGAGFVYFGYNTSAYTSGRYAVDDLADSMLEALLPVTFAVPCYANSEEADAPRGRLTTVSEHPIWQGIDLADAPDLGVRVRVEARDQQTVLATADDDPVLATQRLGQGRVTACTLPYGGQHYQQVAFHWWAYMPQLLVNILEFTATGTVSAQTHEPWRWFAALEQAHPATVEAVIVDTDRSATSCTWEVTIRNTGTVPALYLDCVTDHPDEGRTFDWHVSENYLLLLGGEEKMISVAATAHPGHLLDATVQPTLTAWNARPTIHAANTSSILEGSRQ